MSHMQTFKHTLTLTPTLTITNEKKTANVFFESYHSFAATILYFTVEK